MCRLEGTHGMLEWDYQSHWEICSKHHITCGDQKVRFHYLWSKMFEHISYQGQASPLMKKRQLQRPHVAYWRHKFLWQLVYMHVILCQLGAHNTCLLWLLWWIMANRQRNLNKKQIEECWGNPCAQPKITLVNYFDGLLCFTQLQH